MAVYQVVLPLKWLKALVQRCMNFKLDYQGYNESVLLEILLKL